MTGSAPASTESRHFGTAGPSPSSTQPRQFGSLRQAPASTESRHFGTAGSGPAANGPRRFGSAAPERGPSGQLGYRTANSQLRRVTNGRGYTYRGHTYSRFQAARYNWPRGYRYSRFEIGHAFPRQFWIRDYYIDDYADYGFAPPPPDYEWIRFGPDVLLVSLTTGVISQAIYGAFQEDQGGNDGPTDGYQDQPPADPEPPN